MKTLSMLTLIALAAGAAAMPSAQAATITIPDFDINPGGTHVASASITPDAEQMTPYTGFQFDLAGLPGGLAIDFTASEAMGGFSLKGETQANGAIRLISYTESEAVTTTANILKITFSAAENTPAGTYTINISDLLFSSSVAEDITGTPSTFTITVNAPERPETPQIPAEPIPSGMYGNDNGTYISALKIRQGNLLTMGINSPIGGYPQGWEYIWFDPTQTPIGEGQEIETPAELWGAALTVGLGQATSDNVYTVNVSNYDEKDNEFWNGTFPTASVKVYKRPPLPTQLLRKGQHPQGGQTPETGTSHTFVIMMTPITDAQLAELGVTFTYGYTDRNGAMHELETTSRRYTHTSAEIYNNTDYTFWAYSQWTYSDGSVITSGLRFLDGGEDPTFDASSISGATKGEGNGASGVGLVEADATVTGIYTFDGRFVGTDLAAVAPGFYIVMTTNGVYKVRL